MGMTERDETLVTRARTARDTEAFGTLVRRHQSDVRRWLRHLTGDFARADDLAQETFLKAWNRLSSYRGPGRFKAWLMRIAYTQFLQDRRTQHSRAETVARAEAQTTAPSTTVNPEVSDLERLLAVLSAPEREVMVLTHAHGLSHQEVSSVTGLALGTVKSHLRRGKIKIRERFRIEEPVQ